MRLSIAAALLVFVVAPIAQQLVTPQKGQRLEDTAWPEAERLLTPDTVVVIPLGAGSKEHGPHLKLRNDQTMAEYLTRRVVDSTSVIVAPTLTYHHYPAFLEYPGSTSLSQTTARSLTLDVVRTLSAYGPRRFYVLNTGISTLNPLKGAAEVLATEGILLRYTDLDAKLSPATKGLIQQQGGTHADEVETSMMLFIDPSSVDMNKAVKDYYSPSPSAGRLTRQRGGTGSYSPSGVWGDPTFATAAKGRTLVEALVSGILDDIAQVRSAPLPARSTTPAATEQAGRSNVPTASADDAPLKCTPGDERDVRGIGIAFTAYWNQKDARQLASLWSTQGNIIHGDGSIETGPIVIEQNRAKLFATREYASSYHLLTLTMLRCLTADVAVADGKWELTRVVDAQNRPVPKREGPVTLVVKRGNGRWFIEAYRYTVK